MLRKTLASLCIPFVVLSLAGCAGDSASPAMEADAKEVRAPRAPKFDQIGPHHRKVSTKSPEAQRYFDQGLTWSYAFNHDEAIRSFEEAARIDPTLAMAWWGVALCYGPHINFPMLPEDKARAAWDALEKARALKSHASEVERDLIDALGARYAMPSPADRSGLDQAYADAMQKVYQKYPDDLDIAVLYAESLMDLQPWDMWTKDGQPKGRTLEVVQVLEKVLEKHPRHPGATHLYIHAVEASYTPDKAEAAADNLRGLVRISSHLEHMPSHIYARVGRWNEAIESNRDAVAADAKYKSISPKQDFYMAYMQHNQQFLSFACMMAGRSKEAIEAGQSAVTMLPADWIEQNAGVIDGYLTVHMDALKRFGKWDEILALPAPPEYLPYTYAMWRANRTVALAASGKIDEAVAERKKLDEALARVPEDAMAQQNKAMDVLTIASLVADGEIAYAKKDYKAAIEPLREAVKREDALRYIEPPDWMVPARHTLGAVYLDAGMPAEAEAVYREDLKNWPNNGWALWGLSQALAQQNKAAEADEVMKQFEIAWKDSDIKPHASCLCAPMAMR